MKKLVVLLFFIMNCVFSFAQTVTPDEVVSSGESYTTTYAQITWTMGGMQAATYNNGNTIITEGFIQPILLVKTLTKEIEDNDYFVNVYPNPVKHKLNIKFNIDKKEELLIYLYDLNGKQILTKTLKNNNTEKIDFEKYNNGIYFLKTISSDGKYYENFKIVFQN